MSFKTSAENFRKVFINSELSSEGLKRFRLAIMDYLRSKSEYDEARAFLSYLEEDGKISAFMCNRGLAPDVISSFKQHEIYFVAVTDDLGDFGFIIPATAIDAVKDIQQEILKEHAHYCKTVTGRKLQDIVLKKRTSDKEIVYFCGLSETEALILEQLCNHHFNGEMIAIDPMKDGTYSVGFYAKENASDMRKLYLHAILRAHGANEVLNKRLAHNHARLENAVARGFLRNGSQHRSDAWVIGQDNMYVHVKDDGFEYGSSSGNGKNVTLKPVLFVPSTDEKFLQKLSSYAMRIKDATYTTDSRLAHEHLAGIREKTLDFSVPNEAFRFDMMERQLVDAIDAAVTKKLEKDPTFHQYSRWKDKIAAYMDNASNLLDYSIATLKPLIEYIRANNLDRDGGYDELMRQIAKEQADGTMHKFDTPAGFSVEDLLSVIRIPGESHVGLNWYDKSVDTLRNAELLQMTAEPDYAKIQEENDRIVAEAALSDPMLSSDSRTEISSERSR